MPESRTTEGRKRPFPEADRAGVFPALRLRPRFVLYLHLVLTVTSVLIAVFEEANVAFPETGIGDAAELTLQVLGGSMLFFWVFPILFLVALVTSPKVRLWAPFVAVEVTLCVVQFHVMLCVF